MASLPFTTTTAATTSDKKKLTHVLKPQTINPNPTIPHNKTEQYKSYHLNITSLCKQGKTHQAFTLLTQTDLESLRIGPEIYAELLQGCVYDRDLKAGRQVHAQMIKKGGYFTRNDYVQTKLLIFYAKCDCFADASRLFSDLRVKNEFSWAAVIGLHSRLGLNKEALMGFVELICSGGSADNFVVPNVLKACGACGCVGFGRGVHGYVVKMGLSDCVFVLSSLLDMYGKCGVLDDSRRVFESMTDRNVVSWNSMIGVYVQHGFNEEAIQVFSDMRSDGVEPTRVTLSSILSASANLGAIEVGEQAHAVAVIGGFDLDYVLGSSILNFYCKCSLMDDAELVFNRLLEKDVVSWNLLISGFLQCEKVEKALESCRLMRLEGMRFDYVTLASIISACASMRNAKLGKEGHCYCIRNNLISNVVVVNCVVEMYIECERINDARQVFNSTTHKNLVLWNRLLTAYAELGLSGESLKLFYQMQLEGVPPNVSSWNAVISGFFRSRQVNEARYMLSIMQTVGFHPNTSTWTAIISGLVQNGLGAEALRTFNTMLGSGISPSMTSIKCTISICTDMILLRYGKAIHGYVLRHGFWLQIQVTTALRDMYAKCGYQCKAKRVCDMTRL